MQMTSKPLGSFGGEVVRYYRNYIYNPQGQLPCLFKSVNSCNADLKLYFSLSPLSMFQ